MVSGAVLGRRGRDQIVLRLLAQRLSACGDLNWFFSPSCSATDHGPQETCARILLYRGANKDVKNNNGQTPFQVWGCWGWCGGRRNREGQGRWDN